MEKRETMKFRKASVLLALLLVFAAIGITPKTANAQAATNTKKVPITALFIGPNAVKATEHTMKVDVYESGGGKISTETLNHENSKVFIKDEGEYHYVLLVKEVEVP